MTNGWPDKDNHELWEINEFIKYYEKLPNGKKFEIVGKNLSNKAGPDYIVRDIVTEECFGIELTSVYLDDRSVPDVHMKSSGRVSIPYDKGEVENYKGRLVQAIRNKIKKTILYDKRYPLILSVYMNEYIRIHMNRKDFESLVRVNEDLFDGMRPFSEIVLWLLHNGAVFSVKP